MLIQQVKEDIKSGGLGAGNNFTIAASAKAFEVLSSNLYQNKVLAVIREITCNAVDAHRMVGKSVADIQIHMPGYLAPFFAVRDFGPGLSHDDVLSLYTTYFRSTKDSSNDLIGGFGLGSKSPFAVADQFTVTSWQDGERRQYVCYKDGGVPAINHISTEPSNEPNGLEVRVAVASGQLYRWEEEARNLFKWWLVVPKGIKQVDYALSPTYVTAQAAAKVGDYPEWAICGYVGNPTVLMGGVPYALNFEAIAGLPPQIVQMFSGLGLVLCFEVGQLNISPSREALSYDPTTCALLKQRLNSIVQQATAEVEYMVAKAPTLWEARRLLYANGISGKTVSAADMLRRLGGKMTGIKWQGKPVAANVDFDLSKDFSAPVTAHKVHKSSHRKTWDKSQHAWDYRHYMMGEGNVEFWFWDDGITAKTYRKVQYAAEQEAPHYKDQWNNQRTPSRSVFVLTGAPFDEVEKFFVEKGLPPIRKVADLADPPKVASNKKAGPSTKGYVYNFANNEWARTETPIDLTTGGVCVKFFGGYPTDDIDQSTLRGYIKLGLIDKKAPLVGFQRSRFQSPKFEKALEDNGWVVATKELIHNLPEATIKKDHLEKHLRDLTPMSSDAQILKRLKAIGAKVTNPDYAAAVGGLLNNYVAFDWNKEYPHAFKESYSPAQVKAAKEGEAEALAIFQAWADYKAKHPLLGLVLGNAAASPSDIADYLNR